VAGIPEDGVNAEADWEGFGFESVLNEGLEFGGLEVFLEGVAAGEVAIGMRPDAGIFFLTMHEGGN
jgi:hypothetical protein